MKLDSSTKPVTLREALDLGFRIKRVQVHSNITGQLEDRWLVVLKGRPSSSHHKSSDAIGRVIELATPF